MRLWIYRNGFCDPATNVGIAKQFDTAKEVDDYIDLFVASATVQSLLLGQWRCFVTNDDVEFHDVDHFILMEEPYGLSINSKKIDEVNLLERSSRVQSALARREKARELIRQEAERKQER